MFLWSKFIDLVGVSWVPSNSCNGLLESWQVDQKGMRWKVAWNTIPTAILCSIWKERNLRIFENKTCEALEVFELAKWRLSAWLSGFFSFFGLRTAWLWLDFRDSPC